MRIRVLFLGLIAAAGAPLAAQSVDSAKVSSDPLIQDNSFLVEEAYNQGPGVVQHISTFQVARGTSGFDYGFTQEWPVQSIRHQLSYSIPVSRTDSQTGIGDVGLNYRYQLLGDGDAKLAISPRLSVLLPTGDWKRARGNGAAGLQAAIPMSYVLSPMVAAHFDIGGTVTPSARNTAGDRAQIMDWFVAGSAILTASNRIQPMLETIYVCGQAVVGDDKTARSESFVISPGLRAAFNFASGLQIVPGIAFPIGVGPSSGERNVLFYLSFEHAFTKGR
ncbi:MAG TPA: transporter [Gemmatimonadaceae bacterium]|nr:transporter [Gemmatimonadaceae bacterium]